jgi:hypothetical protein
MNIENEKLPTVCAIATTTLRGEKQRLKDSIGIGGEPQSGKGGATHRQQAKQPIGCRAGVLVGLAQRGFAAFENAAIPDESCPVGKRRVGGYDECAFPAVPPCKGGLVFSLERSVVELQPSVLRPPPQLLRQLKHALYSDRTSLRPMQSPMQSTTSIHSERTHLCVWR